MNEKLFVDSCDEMEVISVICLLHLLCHSKFSRYDIYCGIIYKTFSSSEETTQKVFWENIEAQWLS